MSRYSSDSDSQNYSRKTRRRRRSSSSSNSSSRRRRLKSSKPLSSSGYRKSSKSHRSKSYVRSRSNNRLNSRHSRSSSKNRRRERSPSRKKCKPKPHHKSRLHSKGHSSKYPSRSPSSDSKSSSTSSSSSSSSSPSSSSSSSSSSSTSSTSKTSSETNKKKQAVPCSLNPEEQLREKLLKAIKAAESADHQLKQQGVLAKGVKSRNDIISLSNVKPQSDVIKDINEDGFVQKMFISSKHKKEENFDELNLSKGIEESYVLNADTNSIFHVNFFIDPKVKLDRWVRKLHMIRQRAISGEPLH